MRLQTMSPTRLPRPGLCVAAAAAVVLTLGACGDDDGGTDSAGSGDAGAAASDTASAPPSGAASSSSTASGDATPFATAEVVNADGESLGTATLSGNSATPDATDLSVSFTGLEPGMYGMHVHAVGTCETDSESPDGTKTGDFLSAGGHLGADGHDHPSHGGDLPALMVKEDGTAALTVSTDRITRDNLLDDDGSAIIVHEGPDNYGNIPGRYAPDGPDEESLSTGDAGGRQACGVFGPV